MVCFLQVGWLGQPPSDEFLWADDQFMGLTPLARLAAHSNNADMMTMAAKMALAFADYMVDPADGVLWHGVDGANNNHSCCKWGRIIWIFSSVSPPL